MSDVLKRALITCAQYFVIMIIAATVAGQALESAWIEKRKLESQQVGSVRTSSEQNGVEGQSQAVNVIGMIHDLWNEYYRWWIGIFIGASVFRLLIVLALTQFRRKRI